MALRYRPLPSSRRRWPLTAVSSSFSMYGCPRVCPVALTNWPRLGGSSTFPETDTSPMNQLLVVMNLTSTPPLDGSASTWRSEEHTSELQSLRHLVCRL